MKLLELVTAAICSLAIGVAAVPAAAYLPSDTLTWSGSIFPREATHSLHLRDIVLRARDLLDERDALLDEFNYLYLEKRGTGSRPPSPGPSTPKHTAGLTNMLTKKPDMVVGTRYVFEVVQPTGGTYANPTLQAYCEKKKYKHKLLLVGDVKPNTAGELDFVGHWWDLLKGEADMSTEVAKRVFDPTKGKSLTYTFLGTTTKVDGVITRFGKSA